MRPFRFAAQVPDPTSSVDDWRRAIRRVEDIGFSTLALADHFTGGYTLEPLTTLAAASAATSLRLQTAVLGVDYRHPVLLHRMVATLDVLSEGRVELGIGAGWMRTDYDAAGLTMDRPGVRIERLDEVITAFKLLCGPDPVMFNGKHVTIDGLVGVPAVVQRPHPPILVGGGAPRMLRLAGRVADIVGVNANLSAGDLGIGSVLDVSWEKMAEKVSWAREGAESAGRRLEDLELSMAQWLLHVSDSPSSCEGLLHKMAARVGVEPAWLEDAPGVLVGSAGRVVEKLQELRERLGISYVQVHAGPRGVDLEPVAPVIAALAGH
jgi:probable F420-dependent oxidoreductase